MKIVKYALLSEQKEGSWILSILTKREAALIAYFHVVYMSTTYYLWHGEERRLTGEGYDARRWPEGTVVLSGGNCPFGP